MSLTDWELWACANHVLPTHGDDAQLYIDKQISALEARNDEAGVGTWQEIGRRIARCAVLLWGCRVAVFCQLVNRDLLRNALLSRPQHSAIGLRAATAECFVPLCLKIKFCALSNGTPLALQQKRQVQDPRSHQGARQPSPRSAPTRSGLRRARTMKIASPTLELRE